MSRSYVKEQPKQTTNMTFSDLYKEISSEWEEKARALQSRRWKKLQQSIGPRELI